MLSIPKVQAQSDSTIYESVRLGYRYHFFDSQLADWHDSFIGLKFQKDAWTVLPSMTLARRFEKNSIYLEGDVYRTLKNEDYLNMGGGWSPGEIFVRQQLYFEYYNPFGKWEHSVGVRWMNFSGTGDLGVLTASLSRYYGAMLTSLRLNGAFGLNDTDYTNYTIILSHRYYLGDVKYIGLRGSYGFDNNLILLGDRNNQSSSDASQYTIGMEYNSNRKKRSEIKFAYDWTHYSFEFIDRNQHTLSIYFTLHDRFE